MVETPVMARIGRYILDDDRNHVSEHLMIWLTPRGLSFPNDFADIRRLSSDSLYGCSAFQFTPLGAPKLAMRILNGGGGGFPASVRVEIH